MKIKNDTVCPDNRATTKSYVHTRLACVFLTIALPVFSCGESISEYAPGNSDEKEIIATLVQYQDAKNSFDIIRLIPLLHEDGIFSFECGRMVSKSELKEALPRLWAEIQSGDQTVIPLVHECINGDYVKSGDLSNPRIEIKNDTAEATVKFTSGFCRLPLYFSLLRESDRWLIIRTEWGQN